MPYRTRKQGGKVLIIRERDGRVVGSSTSQKKANASVRARMAGERGGVKGGKRRGK
jgi:hypothetical protein